MPKTRIYELAKQIDVSSKDIISRLNTYGKQVNNHFAALEDGEIKRLTADLKPAPKSEVKKEVKAEISEAERPQRPPEGERPPRPRPEGEQRPPRPEGEQRPLRPRPEGERPLRPRPEGERPLRPRPEGEQRPLRPRPEGERPLRPRPDGERPLRPRPEGERPLRPRPDGERPLRPRPEGERPLRPRPEGERPLRPRPEGERPLRPRPEGERPLRPRPDGERPLRPRPEGERPLRPRPEGERPLRPRPEGERPLRPRPEGERPLRPRPEGEQRPFRPRPDGEQRPPRPRPEGEQRPQHPESQRTDTPRPDSQRPERPRSDGPRPDRPHQDRPFRDNRPPRPDGAPYGQQGQRGPRPPARQGGFNRPPGAGGQNRPNNRPPQGGAPRMGGRPATPGGAGFGARPGFTRPAFGAKKDVQKTAEPSKDDRKQDWKKNEQMRSVKSKDNKDSTDKKENKQFFDRRDGRSRRGAGRRNAPAAVKKIMPKKIEPEITLITVDSEITVRGLAEKLRKSNADIIKILMKKGIMATANQVINYETAVAVAESLNVLVEEYVEVDVFEEAFAEKPGDGGALKERPPVVVVMGHVDHGKTSLLDVIRDTSVTSTEAGGITQHIGAYTVEINGKPITFLDTPGHEAFTAMRMRGAQVTDIAVLVVAANDGVMPQTIEAINHAKAAGVEIIVAINKIDLPGANPDRVKQELTEHGLLVEDWGGEIIAAPVSATQRIGIEHLLEMIILVSEMKELKANPDKPARGSIIEAKLDKQRGAIATVLVQDGTLRVGDPIVAGSCFGRVRAMRDDKGNNIKEAGPSIPAEISGLSEVPSAGDMFYVAADEKQARQLSETVIAKGRESMIKAAPTKVSLDDLFNQIQAGQVKDLNIVVKADVQGSVEALKTSLDKLSNEQVRVRIIHGGVGAVTESDVMLASASNAIILGFNVRPEPMAKSVADAEKVDLRLYRVIYSALDDISAAMKGMLEPEFRERVLGHAEIRQLFKASGVGTIGGAYVTDGKITRGAQVRIVRDGRVVYEGQLETLRRFKEDTREVASGYECGMLFNRFNDIHENDRVEAFIMEEIPR